MAALAGPAAARPAALGAARPRPGAARRGRPRTAPACATPTGARSRSRPGPRDLTRLAAADLAGADLVTASALLDLLTADEVDALAAACAGAGCPALLTLSVAGHVELDPPDPLRRRRRRRVRRPPAPHRGRRRLLGPDAAGGRRRRVRPARRCACGPRPARGGSARTAPADRRTGCAGWVAAAVEQRAGPARRGRAGYLGDRLHRAAGVTVLVQHQDLLAPTRPPPRGTDRHDPAEARPRPLTAVGRPSAGGRGCGCSPCSPSWPRWSRCSAPRRFAAGLHVLTPGAMLAALGHRPGHHRAHRAALAAGGPAGRAAAAARRRRRRDLPRDLPQRGAARRRARRRRPRGPARPQQR